MAFVVAATRRRWRWSAAAGWPVRAAAGLALMRVFAEWKRVQPRRDFMLLRYQLEGRSEVRTLVWRNGR